MPSSDRPVDPVRVPRVKPADNRPNRLRRLFMLSRNPLLAIPEAAYREPLVVSDGVPPVVYVCGPELVDTVLLHRSALFPKDAIQRRVLSPLMGNGVLTSNGDDWRWQRSTVAGLFRHAEILRIVPEMVAAAESAIAGWRSAPAGSIQPVDRHMLRAAYQVIARTILPSDHQAVTTAIEQRAASFEAGIPWAIAASALKLPGWAPHPGKLAMRRGARDLRRLVAGMVTDRRAAGDDRDDLFSRLLNARHPDTGRQMSDALLVDNLLTFLLAGHDTTARALAWALYLVSRAPEWEERIRAEATAVAGSGPITGDQVARLIAAQQVLKETMRLFPPVPTTTRVATADVDLAGRRIKAGTLVIIPIYVIHRHQLLWDDPDRFDPGRFAAEAERDYARNQFMPFGAGPRTCIGAAFALIEGTVMLATLVRAAHFAFAGSRAPEPVARIVLMPKGGLPMRVTVRGPPE